MTAAQHVSPATPDARRAAMADQIESAASKIDEARQGVARWQKKVEAAAAAGEDTSAAQEARQAAARALEAAELRHQHLVSVVQPELERELAEARIGVRPREAPRARAPSARGRRLDA